MTTTPRLQLPMIEPGQAQKELTHNEALIRLDMLSQPAAIEAHANVPPATPELGACWIVGADPEGAWEGHEEEIVSWTEGGWRFVQPFAGLMVWIAGDGVFALWDGSDWMHGNLPVSTIVIDGEQVIGPRQPAIAAPEAGDTIDVNARLVIGQILGTMRTHGLIES